MVTVQLVQGVHGLAEAAFGLGAARVAGLSGAERELAARAGRPELAGDLREQIRAGHDPLGDALCAARGPAERRRLGQTLTPAPVVASMIGWAAGRFGDDGPDRVVDPGTGSARFLLAAGRRWPRARLVGVENDPAGALVARANLAAAGLAGRSAVICGDYRSARLPAATGPTLYLGNPPYVRHHDIPAGWKRWLADTAAGRGLAASGLAGLHAHFFLATAGHATAGDAGAFITAAEWLDVNYGSLIRGLLLGDLGGESVQLIEPAAQVFPDATVTSAICCFRLGARPAAIRLRVVSGPGDLGVLDGGHPVPRARLAAAPRWGPLLRDPAAPSAGRGRALPAGQVELGEICRVHRGQVTGANAIWVWPAVNAVERLSGQAGTGGRRSGQENAAGCLSGQEGIAGCLPGQAYAVPARFRFPAVTRARELFGAGPVLPPGAPLRVVIDLPAELDGLPDGDRELVSAFIAAAASAGAADGYIARHRRPWWRVGLAGPAPILASYMARRPPTFVRNAAGARHLNIAHGLYPREPLADTVLDRLAAHLRSSVGLGQGRTYAGGLTKFEPREMERLPVPWEEIRG